MCEVILSENRQKWIYIPQMPKAFFYFCYRQHDKGIKPKNGNQIYQEFPHEDLLFPLLISPKSFTKQPTFQYFKLKRNEIRKKVSSELRKRWSQKSPCNVTKDNMHAYTTGVPCAPIFSPNQNGNVFVLCACVFVKHVHWTDTHAPIYMWTTFPVFNAFLFIFFLF